MEGQQAQKITVPIGEAANALVEAKRVDRCSVGCRQVLDRFPAKSGVTVESIPVQLAEASKGGDHLPEILWCQAEEHILKLRAV